MRQFVIAVAVTVLLLPAGLAGQQPGIVIEEGERAVSVAVTGNTVGIDPGERVDVLEGEEGDLRVVLQDLEVLAIAEKHDQQGEPVRVATLRVPEEHAATLVEAVKKGPLQLALRVAM